MAMGMGILGWCPSEFWRATLPELTAAYSGYKIANGVKDGDEDICSIDEFKSMKKKSRAIHAQRRRGKD